jgi:hypothetical protein
MLPGPDTVLIALDDFAGHRLMYVRILVDAILSAGSRPALLTRASAPASEEYDAHLGDIGQRLLVLLSLNS